MADLEKAEKEVRDAYIASAVHHQQANARYVCARKEDRAAIAEANNQSSKVVRNRIVKAETNYQIEQLKEKNT